MYVYVNKYKYICICIYTYAASSANLAILIHSSVRQMLRRSRLTPGEKPPSSLHDVAGTIHWDEWADDDDPEVLESLSGEVVCLWDAQVLACVPRNAWF